MSVPEIEPEKCEDCGKNIDLRWGDGGKCMSCRDKQLADNRKSNENIYGTDWLNLFSKGIVVQRTNCTTNSQKS